MTQDDTLKATTIRTRDESSFVHVDTLYNNKVYLSITLSGGGVYCVLSPEQVDELIAALQARKSK